MSIKVIDRDSRNYHNSLAEKLAKESFEIINKINKNEKVKVKIPLTKDVEALRAHLWMLSLEALKDIENFLSEKRFSEAGN